MTPRQSRMHKPGWWRRTLAGWAAEWQAWRQALRSAEGVMVAVAGAAFVLFLAGFLLFSLDWDRLVALSRHGGRCVQYLTNEKAAFFIVGLLTAALLSVFALAEAFHLFLHRRWLKRWWSEWLVGLGLTSAVLWLLLFYGLSAWCF